MKRSHIERGEDRTVEGHRDQTDETCSCRFRVVKTKHKRS